MGARQLRLALLHQPDRAPAASAEAVGSHASVWFQSDSTGVTWSTLDASTLPDLAAVQSDLAIGSDVDGRAQLVRFNGLPHDNMPPPFTIEDLGVHAELHGLASTTFGIVAVGDGGRILVRPAMKP